jgi:hypothetical protein
MMIANTMPIASVFEVARAFPRERQSFLQESYATLTRRGRMHVIGGQNFKSKSNPIFPSGFASLPPGVPCSPVGPSSTFFDDVWSSKDGVTWSPETTDAPRAGRAGRLVTSTGTPVRCTESTRLSVSVVMERGPDFRRYLRTRRICGPVATARPGLSFRRPGLRRGMANPRRTCGTTSTLWLFDHAGREAVPERVHPDALVDARELSRLVHHAVQLPGRHGIERIAAWEITGDVVFMALLRSRCEADRLTPKHTKQSLRTQLSTEIKSKHPYRASGLVLSPIVSLRERLLSCPRVTDRSTSDAAPGPGDPAGAVRPVRALREKAYRRVTSGVRSDLFWRARVCLSKRDRTARIGRQHTRNYLRPTLRPTPLQRERKPHSPAMVISSMRIEPVRIPPRTSMSDPTSTILWYMSLRLPAIVTSCTG